MNLADLKVTTVRLLKIDDPIGDHMRNPKSAAIRKYSMRLTRLRERIANAPRGQVKQLREQARLIQEQIAKARRQYG